MLGGPKGFGRVSHFDILKQSKDYDLEGSYVRHWIPEIASLPTSVVHAPYMACLRPRSCRGRSPHNPGFQTVFFPDPSGYAVYPSVQVPLVRMDRAHTRRNPKK